MLNFVNQKTLDGKVYTAYRDNEEPSLTYIECEDIFKPVVLKLVWLDNNKIISLF